MGRSEAEWIDEARPYVEGTSEIVTTRSDHPACVLWVPDPEQRHGWREVYVDKPNDKPSRSVGFGKPGSR